jgi:predicted Co/Zn/Cd cation transporter (cation efflux family)
VTARHTAVSRVLFRVLILNLAVAVAKIAFGYTSGAISILSDGFHSLTDAASNVVGLVGVRAAARPMTTIPIADAIIHIEPPPKRGSQADVADEKLAGKV